MVVGWSHFLSWQVYWYDIFIIFCDSNTHVLLILKGHTFVYLRCFQISVFQLLAIFLPPPASCACSGKDNILTEMLHIFVYIVLTNCHYKPAVFNVWYVLNTLFNKLNIPSKSIFWNKRHYYIYQYDRARPLVNPW